MGALAEIQKIPQNRMRQKRCFMKHFKLIWVVQSRFKKYFAFAVGQITSSSSPVSRSQEGRTRRHERGARDAMDVSGVAGRGMLRADGEVVWSWCPAVFLVCDKRKKPAKIKHFSEFAEK